VFWCQEVTFGVRTCSIFQLIFVLHILDQVLDTQLLFNLLYVEFSTCEIHACCPWFSSIRISNQIWFVSCAWMDLWFCLDLSWMVYFMYLLKGYGAQSAEEKQRLFKLMRNLNFNGEAVSEPYIPSAQTSTGVSASDGFYSPDFRGDFGAGLLDLHAMDDTELLSEVPHLTWWEEFTYTAFMGPNLKMSNQ